MFREGKFFLPFCYECLLYQSVVTLRTILAEISDPKIEMIRENKKVFSLRIGTENPKIFEDCNLLNPLFFRKSNLGSSS